MTIILKDVQNEIICSSLTRYLSVQSESERVLLAAERRVAVARSGTNEKGTVLWVFTDVLKQQIQYFNNTD